MKYLNKNHTAFLIIVLYGILNFVNYTDAFICVSENHIGLNFFGLDKCCIEYEKHLTNHNDSLCLDNLHKHCEDKHLSVNMQESFSDTYSGLVYVLPDEMKEIIDVICNQYSSLLYSKGVIQARAPNGIYLLSVLKKIRLTI